MGSQLLDNDALGGFAGDPDFMMSLGRGLLVLRLLAGSERQISLAEVSRRSGLSRAAARRCLYTLCQLGYAKKGGEGPGGDGARGAGYVICNDVMTLGRGLMNPNSLAVRAQPLLDGLRDELGESCSIGVLERDHVRYVARAEASRIMSINLRIGSRLPLYATSMGRVLLAGCSLAERQDYLGRVRLTPLTARTVTDKACLSTILAQVERDGFAVLDEELEVGLRSVSVPILKNGKIIAAINVGTSSVRTNVETLKARFVPILNRTAQEIAFLVD
jgi:IclR family pca regulon transcriptional regulator